MIVGRHPRNGGVFFINKRALCLFLAGAVSREPQARSLPLTSEEATKLVNAVPDRYWSERLGYSYQKVLSANLAVNIFTAKWKMYQKVLSAKKISLKVCHTAGVAFLTIPV